MRLLVKGHLAFDYELEAPSNPPIWSIPEPFEGAQSPAHPPASLQGAAESGIPLLSVCLPGVIFQPVRVGHLCAGFPGWSAGFVTDAESVRIHRVRYSRALPL